MSKSNVGVGEAWARAPPPSGPVWRRIANALYNPEEKSFLGRTPQRWAIVVTFYTVFYAVLALMFSACMGGLMLTIDPKTPSFMLDKSLIGNNPGVAFRPIPEEGLVVEMDLANVTSHHYYINHLEEFLKPYKKANKLPASEICTTRDKFGYPLTPCFFIKLNKIFGWEPVLYNDASDLPDDMPDFLKNHISSLEGSMRDQIWMNCWEEKTNETNIEYAWGYGLPAEYYPFVNEDGYLSPFLAIRLTPPVKKLVVIRCRFWAKNIVYNKSIKEPSGYTRIQLHIQNKTKEV